MFSSTPFLWLWVYSIVFAALLAWATYSSDKSPYKKHSHAAIYFLGCLIIELVFCAGWYGTVLLIIHFKAASFTLVTLKFSDSQQKYQRVFTEQVSDEEAVMLDDHFKTHTSIETFFEYDLTDDNNNTQRFYSVNADLLQYVKDKHSNTNPQ